MISAPTSFARRQTISAVDEASDVDVVDPAEQRVVVVVVEVDDVRALALEEVDRHAVDVPAVEEEERSVLDVGGRLVEDVGERQEAVLERKRELLGVEEHHRVLAELAEDAVHREERAERVAVGPLVRREQEAVALGDRLCDRLEVRAGLLGLSRSFVEEPL